jgi:hypothetical protein
MDEKIELKIIVFFTVGYLSLFTLLAIINQNYEFLYYTVIISGLIFLIAFCHKKIHLNIYLLWGLTILGALHILGGNIYIFTTRVNLNSIGTTGQ